MANDIASLGIRVTSDGIAKAETDLEKLTAAGGEAEKAAGSTGAAWAKASAQISSNTGTIVSELQALNKTQSAALSVAESIKSSFDGLSAQLEKVSGSFAKVDTSSASTAKAIEAVGESSDAATSRIKAMVSASLAQADAQAEVLGSAKASAQAQASTAAGYDRVVTAQNKAMAATTKIVEQQEKANAAAKDTAGLKQQQDDLAKLVGQIDPTVSALGRLDTQQEKLAAFKKAGVLGTEDFKAYSASIDDARAKITGASNAAHSFSLNNASARRELGLLAKDVATGQWGNFEQSLGTLASRSGLLNLAFSATGAAVIGATAEVAAFVVAADSAAETQNDLNKALAQTGNAVGVTAAGFSKIAGQVAGGSGSLSQANEILIALAANGKVTNETFLSLGQAAKDFADLTGASADKAAEAVTKMFDGTTSGVLKANEQYHFLTLSTYDQIAALEKEGDAQGAVEVAAKAFHDTIAPRVDEMKEKVTGIAGAWDTVKRSFSGFLDTFKTGASLIAGTADLQTQIYALQGKKIGAQSGNPFTFDSFDGADQAKLDALQKQLADQTAKAEKQGQDQQVQDDGVAGKAALDKYLKEYRSDEQKRQDEVIEIHNAANKAIAAALATGDAKLAQQIMEQEAKAEQEARTKGVRKPPKGKQDPEISAYKTFSGQVDALDVKAITNDDPALTKYQQGIAKLGNELNDYMQKNGDATKAAELFNQGQQALQRTLDQDYKKQDDANAQYAAALDKKNDALQLASDNQVAQVSMGAKEYAQQQQIAKVYRDQADALTNLAIQRQKGIDGQQGGISKSQYDFDVDSVQKHSDQAVAILKNGYATVDQAQGDWKNGVLRAYDEIVDKASNVAGATSSFFTTAFDSMSDSLASFATTGKLNFKSLATSILSDLAKMEVRILASQALQAILGSFGGAVGGGGNINALGSSGNIGYLTANAKGGVYDSPSLAKYSSQIVSKPTMFAFAKGGALGVMGEVPGKSEAIMPLARGSNGELGVTVHGGSSDASGINVNVVVNVASDGSTQTDVTGGNQALGKQFGDAMATAAKKVIAQEIRPGGQIYAAIGK